MNDISVIIAFAGGLLLGLLIGWNHDRRRP